MSDSQEATVQRMVGSVTRLGICKEFGDTRLGMLGDWEEFLGYAEDDHLDKPRKATPTARPAGDERAVENIEKLTGRDLNKGRLEGCESVPLKERYYVPRIPSRIPVA